ncbi:hypothetical protein CERZMDRAFT_89427 [Cercospora zeae-maydis SCOH1-5]|uniref:Uncharacterized protein n=1 Tax=Cercospora zeae-maydis SCOH1-5 TaxID=717836 RepID=A0A6A6EYW9_9PEZI|nr:hypothetical protein CERZMDRAFT_89427 [Cercospora zeae-maydis SCOH1-5]
MTRALYQPASIIGDHHVELCICAKDIAGNWKIRDEERFLRGEFWPLKCMGPRAEVSLLGFRIHAVQSLTQDFAINQTTRANLVEFLRLLAHLEETVALAKQAGVSAFHIYPLLHKARKPFNWNPTICFDAAHERCFGKFLATVKCSMEKDTDYDRVRCQALSVLRAREADAKDICLSRLPGLLHRKTNNTAMMAYLHNRFDYNTCTLEELRTFLKRRAKGDSINMTKDELVARLESLDKDITFPLMSLPLELRLNIYDELAFHPQILATDREINAEARPILQGRHTVTTLRIARRIVPPERRDPGRLDSESAIKVDDGTWLHAQPHGNGSRIDSLQTQLASWPVEVVSARHLDVIIDCSGGVPTSLCLPVYLLATLLTNKSQDVRVRLENFPSVYDGFGWPRKSPEDLLASICWPLLLMGCGVELVIQGVQKESIEDFKNAFNENRHVSTTALYRSRILQDRIQNVIDLAKEAGIGSHCFELFSGLKRLRDVGETFAASIPGADPRLPDGIEPFSRADSWLSDRIEDLEQCVHRPCETVRQEASAILGARRSE